jgi:hypothetical protein
MHWLRCAVFVTAVAVAGCGRGAVNPDVPADNDTRLGEKIEIDLEAWLALPRVDLAKLADERAEEVAKRQEQARSAPDSLALLPRLHPPTTVPVFRQAKYNAGLGVSLPPYVKEAPDSAVAFHLARHGDHEAALKLADSSDRALLGRLEAVKPGKNYPVEWTRLVGLVLQSAHWKLAEGHVDGATELVLLHRQLARILDSRAAGGPLGAALLPAGKLALTQAVAAWRDPKVNKPALADDVEAALKEWGPVPATVPALPPGSPRADVAGLFGAPARGRAVLATTPEAARRVGDLLTLATPDEGLRGAAAFLDAKDRLAELLLVYRSRIEAVYGEPQDLAYPLREHGYQAVADPARSPGLLRQEYRGEELSYEVTRVIRGNVAGAFLRVGPVKAAPALPFGRDPRDFGPVHLDRTFETNRVGLAPNQAGRTLLVTDKKALAGLTDALDLPAPAAAGLEREKGHDVLRHLTLTWPADLNHVSAERLLPPLWSDFGPGKLEGVDDSTGGYLTFTWEDGTTRLRLRLPFDEKPPELVAEDRRGSDKLEERLEAAVRRDREERKARLAAGKPITRLPRGFEILNERVSLERLRLGQPRAEAEAALPRGTAVRRRPIPGGGSLLFRTNPPPTATYWARQLIVRFEEDRVAEIRVLYQEGPGIPERKAPTLPETLQKDGAGKPESVPAEWAGLWADLVKKPKAVKSRWQDDRTVRTFQRDAGGAEVVLLDRPADRPQGVELPPLEVCPCGVERCSLGDSRDAVHSAWRTVESGGADVFRLPASSPYEFAMAWYEAGKVSRIVAGHRHRPGADPKEVAAALQKAWRRDFDRLGFVCRQEGAQGAVLGRYGWHDDRTRVQTWVQDTESGPRTFTEWRRWPVTPDKPVASRR